MATDITFDIIGRDRASAAFRGVGRSAKSSADLLGGFGKVARRVFAAGLIYAGAKKATGALAGLAKAAADDQTSAKLMAKQFRNSAKATREQISATEDWITKQGVAKGVADDQLRPALSNLITATHDVNKAQKLTSLAMDIAAAKGKPLSAVSLALSKAYNGNVGALGRLGIKTKDAAGKTLKFSDARKMLNKEFGGTANEKAKTFNGVMDRFRVMASEAGEAIGYKLLPFLTKAGDWFLSKGAPAVGKFVGGLRDKLIPVAKDVVDFIRERLIPGIKDFFGSTGEGAGTLGRFKDTVKSAFDNVRSILDSAHSIFQSFWAKYGDLITKYGVGTLKNFLTVVKGTFDVVAGIFKTVAAVLKGDWSGAWDGIKQTASGALTAVRGLVSQGLNYIKSLFSGAARTIGSVMSAARSGLKSGATNGMQALGRQIKTLPWKIVLAIGDLSKILWDAGRQVIAGLIGGIKSKAGDLGGALGGVVGSIPGKAADLLHINSPSKLMIPIGSSVVEGLIVGIKKRKKPLAYALEEIRNLIQSSVAKVASLKEVRSGFASTFAGDSIFGSDVSGGLGGLLAFQQGQSNSAAQLLGDIQMAISKGLSKSLVSQLQSAGSSGAAALHLLAGASAGDIAQFNALDKATSQSLTSAGILAGNYVRGGDINKQITAAEVELATERGMLRALTKAHLSAKVSGRDIILVLRAEAKSSGKPTVRALEQ